MDKTNLLESLSVEARRQRAMTTKRREPQLQRSREIAAKRMATDTTLMRRARHMARDAIRARFAGQQGADYAKLSPGQKVLIDKIIDGKDKLITRLAQKLLPRVRTGERDRLNHQHKSVLKEEFDVGLEEEFVATIVSFSEEISVAAETMQLPARLIEDILLFEGVSTQDEVLSRLTQLCPVDLDDRLNILIKESTDKCTRVALFNPATGEYKIEEIDAQIGTIQDHPSIAFYLKHNWLVVSINGPRGPEPVRVAMTNSQRARRVGDDG